MIAHFSTETDGDQHLLKVNLAAFRATPSTIIPSDREWKNFRNRDNDSDYCRAQMMHGIVNLPGAMQSLICWYTMLAVHHIRLIA